MVSWFRCGGGVHPGFLASGVARRMVGTWWLRSSWGWVSGRDRGEAWRGLGKPRIQAVGQATASHVHRWRRMAWPWRIRAAGRTQDRARQSNRACGPETAPSFPWRRSGRRMVLFMPASSESLRACWRATGWSANPPQLSTPKTDPFVTPLSRNRSKNPSAERPLRRWFRKYGMMWWVVTGSRSGFRRSRVATTRSLEYIAAVYGGPHLSPTLRVSIEVHEVSPPVV